MSRKVTVVAPVFFQEISAPDAKKLKAVQEEEARKAFAEKFDQQIEINSRNKISTIDFSDINISLATEEVKEPIIEECTGPSSPSLDKCTGPSSQNLNLGELPSASKNVSLKSKSYSDVPVNLVKLITWLKQKTSNEKGVWIPCSQKDALKLAGITHRKLFENRKFGKEMGYIDFKVEDLGNSKMTYYCLGEKELVVQ